jgi:predicted RNA-binding protein with PIN domain
MAVARLKRLLIVDGYNVLRSGDYYQEPRGRMDDFGDEAFNAARDALVNDVALFAGHDYQAVVVFDGAGNRHSDGQPTLVGGVEVIFSAAGALADSVIEQRVKQAVAAGSEVLVVTSDATTQWTVLGNHVSRMSAAGFYAELHSIGAEERAALRVAPKNTLGERLPPDVLARLRELYG